MKKILFVDDEINLLDGLKRMLRGMRNEWQMAFAPGAREALEILGNDSFDVIVTDMRMPGMDGCRLLNEVKERFPNIVRIILSGHSDKEEVLKSIGPVHQYLSKPCDAQVLKSTIARACTMQDLLENDSLIKIVSRIESLPSLPALYAEVIEAVNSPDGSLARVGEIISQDLGMAAKILQLVNSSFFGLPTHVSSPARAVAMLGIETVKALVLGVKIFSQFSMPDLQGYSIASLWNHSVATSCLAKNIAEKLKLKQTEINNSFLAGLLHDTGKLILLDRLPTACEEIVEVVISSGCPLFEAEQKVLGATHAQVGAYLLGIWGFPRSIVNGIAFHHCPGKCSDEGVSILTVVHLANGFEHKNSPDTANKALNFDLDYLSKLGIGDRLDTLRIP
ncbi:MAG: response regulator [Syntrophobacteraceae bacterium]|nr:response regulator [Syntrophobacteraceae bacterium]